MFDTCILLFLPTFASGAGRRLSTDAALFITNFYTYLFNMKRTKLFTALMAVGLLCQAQAQDDNLFTPVVQTELRAPSVPLVTSDPYFSIWSPYDKLYDGITTHWTDAEYPLVGAVRVDGTVYRFLGKVNLETLLPMAGMDAWEGAYTFQQPEGQWTETDYDDAGWKRGKGAFGKTKAAG